MVLFPMDCRYHLSGMLTEKSDVYAFGIVLMEILTGLPVIGEHHMHIAQRVRLNNRIELLQFYAWADSVSQGCRFAKF